MHSGPIHKQNSKSMALCSGVIARVARLLFLTLCTLTIIQAGSDGYSVHSMVRSNAQRDGRKLMALMESEPLRLYYRGGTIFSGNNLPVYIIWYGTFSPSERSHVLDFFASFQSIAQVARPSVSSWWALTAAYKDAQGSPVASAVELKREFFDDYSMGRDLTEDHIEGLLGQSLLHAFPAGNVQTAFYLVLTAADVYVDGMCTRRCGSHFTTKENLMSASPGSIGQKIPYAWVGNAATQCPGKCAWPFATGEFGYETEPLKAHSGDVGAEGMIINIAAMLAGTATNPLNDGFFQGDEEMPLEAATACTGMFGQDSYSGYPGVLQLESTTGASFNANGINNRKYLLPSLWNPVTNSCSHPLP